MKRNQRSISNYPPGARPGIVIEAWDVQNSQFREILYYEHDTAFPELDDICVMLHGAERPIVFLVELDDLVNIERAPESYRRANFV